MENIITILGRNIDFKMIGNLKISGDWELDHMELESRLQQYFHDVIGIYNDNIGKAILKATNDFIVTNYPEYNLVVDYSGYLIEE